MGNSPAPGGDKGQMGDGEIFTGQLFLPCCTIAFSPEIGSTPKTGCAALIIFIYQLKKKECLILWGRKHKVKLKDLYFTL